MSSLSKSFLALGLILHYVQSHAQCSCANDAFLDWNSLTWSDGDLSNDYDIVTSGAQTVNVAFNITTNASGSFSDFGVNTPYEDGPGASGYYFNSELDLGVIFNPAANQNRSPVVITVNFDQEVTCLKFEISDIDISGSSRRDQVRISANAGAVTPTLSVVSRNPTVSVNNNGRARAIGGNSGANSDGSASEGTKNGNVEVDFGTTAISSVRIVYQEISGQADPSGRGIGLFGSFTFCPPSILPLNLISFNVADNPSDCAAEVSWKSAEEVDIDHYMVSFSRDGYDFEPIGTVEPLYSAGINEYRLQSNEEAEGYFQLAEVTIDGTINQLSLRKFDPTCVGSESSLVYPNPVTGQTLSWQINSLTSQEHVVLDIYDAYGHRIPFKDEYSIRDKALELVIVDLPRGNYVLRAQMEHRVYHEVITIVR